VVLFAGGLAVLEQGVVDASLLSVPENIIAFHKGYNELIFLGDVLSFPQNGFGTSVSRIQQYPEEAYRGSRHSARLDVRRGRSQSRSKSATAMGEGRSSSLDERRPAA
jgi:hypothetical protein